MTARFLALVVMLGATLAAQAARVTYTMSFKGSQPAFVNITIAEDGTAALSAKDQDADPEATIAFAASPKVVREVFADAAALGDFDRPLESKQKVAFTGEKMLAYDDAGHHGSQMFTYTEVPPAARLVALMQKISVAGVDALRIQRTQRYQPLNLLELMEQVQNDWADHQMAEPQVLSPTLQALIANPAALQAAKDRAQKLLTAFGKAGR